MEDVVVHEYHYAGGPLTYEYPIDAALPNEHIGKLSDFVRNFVGCSSEKIRRSLSTRWEHLPTSVRPIATFLLSLNASSIAFTDWPDGTLNSSIDDSWIVFRGTNQQELLLGESGQRSAVDAEWLSSVSGLSELLSEFSNLRIGTLPPYCGFYASKRLIKQSDADLCWGATGEWENGLPIFHDGSGNSICISERGAVGIWSSSNEFQYVGPTLADFVTMFVHRQRTGSSPQNQWWW